MGAIIKNIGTFEVLASMLKPVGVLLKLPFEFGYTATKSVLKLTAYAGQFGLDTLNTVVCWGAISQNGTEMKKMACDYEWANGEDVGSIKNNAAYLFDGGLFLGTWATAGFYNALFTTAAVNWQNVDKIFVVGKIAKGGIDWITEKLPKTGWKWENVTHKNVSSAQDIGMTVLDSGIPGLLENHYLGTHLYLGYMLAKLHNASVDHLEYLKGGAWVSYVAGMAAIDFFIWTQGDSGEIETDVTELENAREVHVDYHH